MCKEHECFEKSPVSRFFWICLSLETGYFFEGGEGGGEDQSIKLVGIAAYFFFWMLEPSIVAVLCAVQEYFFILF